MDMEKGHRVEKYYIRRGHSAFGDIDELSYRSKCVRNSALYVLRQVFFGNRGLPKDKWVKMPTYPELLESLRLESLKDEKMWEPYLGLHSKIRQAVIKQAHLDFMNFMKALKSYNSNPSSFTGKPKPPGYTTRNKRYISGGHRSSVYFSPQCISLRGNTKSTSLRLSEIDYEFELISENLHTKSKLYNPDGSPVLNKSGNHSSTETHSIKAVAIHPEGDGYTMVVTYDLSHPKAEHKRKTIPLVSINQGLSAGIDLGVRNLAAVAFGDFSQSLLVKGQVLLSINSYAAKLRGENQSLHDELMKELALAKTNKTKNINSIRKKLKKCELMARIIERKREHKVTDYIHKCTTALANRLAEKGVSDVYVGYNPGWKQEVNLGRVNNQNFTQIPHLKFVEQLEFKCKIRGIAVHRVDERNTSKASFLDNDELCDGTVFSGKRQRKWYTTKNGTKINADINAAYNIIRAGNGNFTSIWDVNNPVKGFVVSPVCLITQCNERFSFAA